MTALLRLLAGSQILTSLATVSIARRTAASAGSKAGPKAERIAKDQAAAMAFAACRNTLRARNPAPADPLPAATPVDSGVVEIVRKEEADWAYIKG